MHLGALLSTTGDLSEAQMLLQRSLTLLQPLETTETRQIKAT